MNKRGSSACELLESKLSKLGAPALVPLDVPLIQASQLNYLDLLPKQARHKGAGLTAVVEHQGTALLYLVDESGKTQSLRPKDIRDLQRLLANRSESAWLGIVNPGSLDLYPVEFAKDEPTKPLATILEKADEAPVFFQSLVHATFRESKRLPSSDYVYQQILALLKKTTDTFVPTQILNGLEVLSMTGRALFFRFLVDRHIVLEQELAEICPSAARGKGSLKEVFSTPARAAETSAWLDATFNGDFLPLALGSEKIPSEDRSRRQKAYSAYYNDVERNAGRAFFSHLDAILHGWDPKDGGQQLHLNWNELDFAHIPVGVLSEVYEHFSHKVDAKGAAETSVHYTPRFIAQFMVQEAFESIAVEQRADARVLDPSCGAGIFLVLAFRKLFEAEWLASGQRPDKKAIQRILYEQLRGFDVSESALRLSALALYITAIELNATQRPPSELKMPNNLRGTVLHHFGYGTAEEIYGPGKDAKEQGLLGSLGALPSREGLEDFDGTFDLVIGNPPWTRLRDESPAERSAKGVVGTTKDSGSKKANQVFTAIGKRVLEQRGLFDLAKKYANPDAVPDLPFLWRAAEWAKPGAMIAFAMHSRLLLHTQGKKERSWQAVREAFAFTGILNGADLNKTAVWPEVDIAWCVAFAANRQPSENSGFYFSTPCYERPINGSGRFRIDYASVNPLRASDLKDRPWLLKTLTFGTWLDVDVMARISGAFEKTLEERWFIWDSSGDKTGQGYNRSPGLKQKPARFLAPLLDFERPIKASFSVHWGSLKSYFENHKAESAYRPKTLALYEPPLVIVPQAPSDDPLYPKAFIADRNIAFNQSYYGYSCAGHSHAEILASMIHLVAHSTLARYFILMRSASLGSDFMRFLKADFDALPFPDVSTLSKRHTKSIQNLSARLSGEEGRMPDKQATGEQEDLFSTKAHLRSSPSFDHSKATAFWKELNDFIFELYGLGPDDVQVIEDTLFSSAPYRRAGEDAFKPTTEKCRRVFCAELQSRLQPFFSVTGETVSVGEPRGLRQEAWDHSWRFVSIWVGESAPSVPASLIAAAMKDANETGASIVAIGTKERGLLVGILDARRWWTRSRALLCARHILQDKLSAFDEKPAAKRK